MRFKLIIFTISDNSIDAIWKRRYRTTILASIIIALIYGFFLFFNMENISINIYVIGFCIYTVTIPSVLYFSSKMLKKNLKSVKYTIEGEKIFIKNNDYEQFNFSKNEIKCINRYKNKEIIIFLNTNERITVNKYLDNLDKLIEILNTLSKIDEIYKNPDVDGNSDMTKQIGGILIITFYSLLLIIIKIFNISIPRVNRYDPMIILTMGLPIVIYAVIIVFISSIINKRIKSKKYIYFIYSLSFIIFVLISLMVFYWK